MKQAMEAPRPARPSGNADEFEELLRELASLRVDLREATNQFQLRWQAELNQVERAVAQQAPDKKIDEWRAFAAEALETIRETRIKAKRGRMKDLLRIRQVAQELRERLP